MGPDVSDIKSDIVKLRGPNKLTKEMAKGESSYQVKVPIFKQFYKGGANIKKIRDETDTKIDLPDSGSDSDMISITGKKANVNKAVSQLQEIQSEMAHINTKEIKIPAKIHNTVIGAGGKLSQSIMSECDWVSFNIFLLRFPRTILPGLNILTILRRCNFTKSTR